MTFNNRGFDTLTLSIKAILPPDLFAQFCEEKALAEELGEDVLVNVNGVPLHIKKHGGNGYAIIASGGPHGATWFFKKPNPKDPWGVRVSFGSEFLALFGLGEAKAHLEDVLAKFEIQYQPQDVSIARVDFCVDILAPEFELEPECFVMHGSTVRRDYVTAEDQSVHGKSGRVTSVTVGSSANRQVIIYDKRNEVIAKRKPHWWHIWKAKLRGLAKQDAIPASSQLDTKDPKFSRIWRVEFRAGKALLKDRWNIRTWSDLFDRFGDLCAETGKTVRYCSPSQNDTNRARWPNHPLWDIACNAITDDLFELRSHVDPCAVKEVHKETHITTLERNMFGLSLSLAALQDCAFDDLSDHFEQTCRTMKDHVRTNPTKTRKQLQAAKDRYVFLQADSAPKT